MCLLRSLDLIPKAMGAPEGLEAGDGTQFYVLKQLVWQSVKGRGCGMESVASGEAGMDEQGGAG